VELDTVSSTSHQALRQTLPGKVIYFSVMLHELKEHSTFYRARKMGHWRHDWDSGENDQIGREKIAINTTQ
jgi:hypothetical protein